MLSKPVFILKSHIKMIKQTFFLVPSETTASHLDETIVELIVLSILNPSQIETTTYIRPLI